MGVARDLTLALDPSRFAADALGIIPDPWQEHVLTWRGKRLILCCARQTGKSTISSVLALHQALYTPSSLILLVSASARQSSELFRKVTEMLARLETPPRLIEDNKLSMQLENGSRVVSLPSSDATIRGFSAVDLLIEDEAAWVSDALHKATRPMLAVSGGRQILMSTPFGKRGHFWSIFEQGGSEWERIKVTARECPRISPEFLEEERRNLGALWFKSEYECEFTETVDAVFTHEMVMGAFTHDIAPLFAKSGSMATPGALPDELTRDAHPPLFES